MTVISAVYLVAGVSLLLAALLPAALRRLPVSAPMVLVGVGVFVGLGPMPRRWVMPADHRVVVEHLTEVCVLFSLMGVGLALDRPLSLRSWTSLKAWSASWRLLALGMPLTIAGVALSGHWLLGLTPAAALLLGAALAPTDPVLASDVQVDGPTSDVEPGALDEDHEVRFGLTAEAGLNDGLSFPFVMAAIAWAAHGHPTSWALHWFAWDLVARIVIGVAVGMAVGWTLGRLAFRPPRQALRRVLTGEPLLAVACLALAYGLAETVHGYGFLSVFVAAMTLRRLEPAHSHHQDMHEVVERLELLATLLLLLLLGTSLTNGLLDDLTWGGVAVALLLVFVIRPLAGWISLGIRPAGEHSDGKRLTRADRAVMSFFGVRGIGTVYYLAYATGHGSFPEGVLWSTAAFTIVLSVLVHGGLAGIAMGWLDRRQPTDG